MNWGGMEGGNIQDYSNGWHAASQQYYSSYSGWGTNGSGQSYRYSYESYGWSNWSQGTGTSDMSWFYSFGMKYSYGWGNSAMSYGGGYSGNYAGFQNSYWYCNNAMVDFSSIFALLSNYNLFSGFYEITEDGQIVGTINIAGILYNFKLSPAQDTSPVPLPGSLLFLGSSAGLFGIIKRRLG